MSRQAAIAAIALLLGAPIEAQAQPAASAAEALRAAEQAYGPPVPPKKCPTVQEGEEIVVCAVEQEQSQFRYSDNEEAKERYARETMDKGAPRAPEVAGPGIFRGPATASGCIPGLTNCPAPPAYFIDFAELPEAPPGSDADRVGRGLAPRGDDGNAAPPEPVTPPESASPEEQP